MTVEIPISKGYTALVDEGDLPIVEPFKWYMRPGKHTVYAQTVINAAPALPVNFVMHRLILGATAGQHVDHVDGNGLNNTRANLRICTNAQNTYNARKRAACSSNFKGVSPIRNKWRARIAIDGTEIHLGTFDNEISAAKAYDSAARARFGQFARTNF